MSIYQRKKVFIGLSGGVDSSVSAALLKERGFDVTGVFIRVWSGDAELKRNERRGTEAEQGQWRDFSFSGCTAAQDRLDSMRICAKLNIPFVELDLEKEYKKEVVDYMIREYTAGKTPNPDVFCNRFIKFGGFYSYALAHGADYVATGHYARIVKRKSYNSNRQKSSSATSYTLHVSSDSEKDQSYFLWQIRREQLPHILFPVGGMKKPEVRKLAKKFGLITADKKDSQGLCFVGKVDMKEFLSHHITPKKGKILLGADGRGLERGLTQMKEVVIGEHDGAFFYTIGERIGNAEQTRKGERGTDAELASKPLYVVAKDVRKNTLTVSHKNSTGELPLARKEVLIKNCNWLVEPRAGKVYSARARYRQPLQRARIHADANADKRGLNRRTSASSSATFSVRFESPQNAVSGQSLVLYDGDALAGGGIIE